MMPEFIPFNECRTIEQIYESCRWLTSGYHNGPGNIDDLRTWLDRCEIWDNSQRKEIVDLRSHIRSLEQQRDELFEALCTLVSLKKGPRDEVYEREKPLAWKQAFVLISKYRRKDQQ